MEKIVEYLAQMWTILFYQSSTTDIILALSNVVGSVYTFLVSYYVFTKIEDYENKAFTLNFWVARGAIAAIMVGCFLRGLSLRIPEIHEVILMAGLTGFLTYIAILLKNAKYNQR